MAAINDVRSELTERLDRIELRLRDVEDFQTKSEALEEAQYCSTMAGGDRY